MKQTPSTPALRISNTAYVRIMNLLLAECADLKPNYAMDLIEAVNDYLLTGNLRIVHMSLTNRLRDIAAIIDRAALRSARARQAALNRP
ncbi:MAG: hypothetical protein K2K49_00320, partial [Duncaniella sp.]|nr:hypothetical protein [Duncaniella sp.]